MTDSQLTTDLFAGVTPDRRAQIERMINVTDYPAGHIFYAPEDAGEQIYILRRGRIRLYKLSPEGRTLTLMVLEPPAVFGEMALTEHLYHDNFAEASTDCSVGAIARIDLRRAMEQSPDLLLQMMALINQRLRLLEQKLADIAFKSVPRRLATVLLSLARADTDGTQQVSGYTHQQLAELIGSYRETVTKALGEFRENGIIRVEGDVILLTDPAQLHVTAEC